MTYTPRLCDAVEWRKSLAMARARRLGAKQRIEMARIKYMENIFKGTIIWHKGPALGGTGTAPCEEGKPRWYDGDTLTIIIDTNNGREIAVVNICADEDFFSVTDASSGDTYDAWEPESWAWWAKLEDKNLPPVESK